jgi:hypothetical protein
MIRRWTYQYEPTLEDPLSEPIIRQVMACDGQNPDDIRRFFKEAGTRNRFVSGRPRLAAG